MLDYTKPLKDVLIETEGGIGALTYRYTYGLRKNSVAISCITNGAGNLPQGGIVKMFYHHDRLGSTHYLTDNIDGKVTSFVLYDDWGALTSKAVLRIGVRELDLVQNYTGHPADMVLGMYYAKARMYDAVGRRFMAVDLLKGCIINTHSLNTYIYVENNPIMFIDLFGLEKTTIKINNSFLSINVDTDNIDSVVDMLNLFTYGKKEFNVFGWKDKIIGYNYVLQKIIDINFYSGMGVKDIFNNLSFYENINDNGQGIYYTTFACGYSVNKPLLGSQMYSDMINAMTRYQVNTTGISGSEIYHYDLILDRMMRDVNNHYNFFTNGIENINNFANQFSNILVTGGTVTKEINYFRNKLNWEPETRTEAEDLVRNNLWYRVPNRDFILHQITLYNPDAVGNIKYMSIDGMYEAIYNAAGLVVTEKTDAVNMGTFNYVGNYSGLNPSGIIGHAVFDVIPWLFYGTSESDPTSFYDRANAMGIPVDIITNINIQIAPQYQYDFVQYYIIRDGIYW